MTEPPCRKRFQIHLSTAIVMMFVAGGLMWANVIERESSLPIQLPEREDIVLRYYGWPLAPALETVDQIPDRNDVSRYYPLPIMIAIDLAIAVFILCAVWFLCEWLIRRRAARKGS